MTLVKICGMTHPGDVALAVAAGADRLGFVIEYPQANPWTLTRARATELMALVPAGVARVAVVGGDVQSILDIVDEVGPDMVQVHDDGPPDVVAGLTATGIPVVKALRIDIDAGMTDAATLISVGRRFVQAGARELLVDSKTASRPAGTGIPVDRELARRIAAAVGVPVILAGGLDRWNVAAAVREVRPAGVDVISGVEGPGHRKDAALLAAFVAAVSDADQAGVETQIGPM